jgi:hypothetical protein
VYVAASIAKMTTTMEAFERSALSRKVALVGAILDNFVHQESCPPALVAM